jgi:hypothetical protein
MKSETLSLEARAIRLRKTILEGRLVSGLYLDHHTLSPSPCCLLVALSPEMEAVAVEWATEFGDGECPEGIMNAWPTDVAPLWWAAAIRMVFDRLDEAEIPEFGAWVAETLDYYPRANWSRAAEYLERAAKFYDAVELNTEEVADWRHDEPEDYGEQLGAELCAGNTDGFRCLRNGLLAATMGGRA